jgi:cell division septum initiation protein DivIVA
LQRQFKLKQGRHMSTAPWFLDTSSPEEVARANFPIVRRGFDPVEVQAFARAVGNEIARLQGLNTEYADRVNEAESRASARVDETTVAEFLGEESSRLLMVARDTANEVRARAEEYANVTVRSADSYAKTKTTEADTYAAKTTRDADDEAARTRREARADAEKTRADAQREAERLIAETMAHRAQLLSDLTQRRDKALEQLRRLLAGRDTVVAALDQVRLTAAGLTGDLEEIVATPSSFVSLDPAIEGAGDVQDDAASLTVSRDRRARTRRPRASGADTGTGTSTIPNKTQPMPTTTDESPAPAPATPAAPAAEPEAPNPAPTSPIDIDLDTMPTASSM